MRPIPPLCSVRDCDSAAGVIINDAPLCGNHAVVELERRKLWEKSSTPRKSAMR